MAPAKAHRGFPEIFRDTPGALIGSPPSGKQMLDFFKGREFFQAGFLRHRLSSFLGSRRPILQHPAGGFHARLPKGHALALDSKTTPYAL
jgi:hypothetical protein